MSCSRRQFLAASALAGLAWENSVEGALFTRREPRPGDGVHRSDFRPQPWGRPLVGCQLFVWGQYASRSGTPVDHDRIFAGLKAAGYDYAEGNLNVQDPEANAQFSERLRHHGLVPVSLYTGGEFHITGRASATVRRVAEAARVAVRHVRRDGMDVLKKMEKDHKISEDDGKRSSDQVQKACDDTIAEVDKMLAAKEKEILTV